MQVLVTQSHDVQQDGKMATVAMMTQFALTEYVKWIENCSW